MVPVSSRAQECGWSSGPTYNLQWNRCARYIRAWRTVSCCVMPIRHRVLPLVRLPSTSINSISLRQSVHFLNLLARDVLCFPRKVFPRSDFYALNLHGHCPLHLHTVPLPWMRRGSWCRLSTPGYACAILFVLSHPRMMNSFGMRSPW